MSANRGELDRLRARQAELKKHYKTLIRCTKHAAAELAQRTADNKLSIESDWLRSSSELQSVKAQLDERLECAHRALDDALTIQSRRASEDEATQELVIRKEFKTLVANAREAALTSIDFHFVRLLRDVRKDLNHLSSPEGDSRTTADQESEAEKELSLGRSASLAEVEQVYDSLEATHRLSQILESFRFPSPSTNHAVQVESPIPLLTGPPIDILTQAALHLELAEIFQPLSRSTPVPSQQRPQADSSDSGRSCDPSHGVVTDPTQALRVKKPAVTELRQIPVDDPVDSPSTQVIPQGLVPLGNRLREGVRKDLEGLLCKEGGHRLHEPCSLLLSETPQEHASQLRGPYDPAIVQLTRSTTDTENAPSLATTKAPTAPMAPMKSANPRPAERHGQEPRCSSTQPLRMSFEAPLRAQTDPSATPKTVPQIYKEPSPESRLQSVPSYTQLPISYSNPPAVAGNIPARIFPLSALSPTPASRPRSDLLTTPPSDPAPRSYSYLAPALGSASTGRDAGRHRLLPKPTHTNPRSNTSTASDQSTHPPGSLARPPTARKRRTPSSPQQRHSNPTASAPLRPVPITPNYPEYQPQCPGTSQGPRPLIPSSQLYQSRPPLPPYLPPTAYPPDLQALPPQQPWSTSYLSGVNPPPGPRGQISLQQQQRGPSRDSARAEVNQNHPRQYWSQGPYPPSAYPQ